MAVISRKASPKSKASPPKDNRSPLVESFSSAMRHRGGGAQHQEQRHHGDAAAQLRPDRSIEDEESLKKHTAPRCKNSFLRSLWCPGSKFWRRLSSLMLCLSILFVLNQVKEENEYQATVERKQMYIQRRKLCTRASWQYYRFVNCNTLHEVDLDETMIRSHDQRNANETIGYLAKGYWRSVLAVNPSSMDETVVLKMMRSKHEVSDDSFDRHRRDALVMERLTSSPHVVDTYGYCGNSVLTEFIPTPLDKLVQQEKTDSLGVQLRGTPVGKLRMALDVARGMAALHEIQGGPILHVDLQPRQFLVTPEGRIKINDFNRCRFMGTFKKTGKKCDFGIISAPGASRAPEEYTMAEQDEKLDIFSMANVFYAILVGHKVWTDYSYRLKPLIQIGIQHGLTPYIPRQVREENAALYDLTMKTYSLNPKDRPSAAQVVKDLERILEEVDPFGSWK